MAVQLQPRFDAQVVLITGAAQGIGAAVAQKMAAQGAILALFDNNASMLAQVSGQLQAAGCQVMAFVVDVADSAAVRDAVAKVEEEFGVIDVLVNVAGVLQLGKVLDYSDEAWARTFAVNVGGVFTLCRAVARGMQARRSGVMITVGSNAASIPRQQMAAYCASKAASAQFMRCLGLELAEYGIRCNVVAPGSTDTAMQRQLWRDASGEQAAIAGNLTQYRLGIPMQRIASSEDIADSVCFLASSEARHITMQTLVVDGGAGLGA